MRGEGEAGTLAEVAGKGFEALGDTSGVGSDEIGMIVKDPQLVHARGFGTDRGLGPRDIFAVLATAGIGAIRGQHETDGVLDPVAGHLGERVGEERMPVAVAPVNR